MRIPQLTIEALTPNQFTLTGLDEDSQANHLGSAEISNQLALTSLGPAEALTGPSLTFFSVFLYMRLLISAATRAEIAPFMQHFDLTDAAFMQGPGFDVVITGVGMSATAFALCQAINAEHDFLLNVGIAGSFDRQVLAGTLVCVAQDTFSELGAEDHDDFLTSEMIGLGKNTFHGEIVGNLPTKKAITVNSVHGNALTISKVLSSFSPDIESMEGAANFYCAEQVGIKCGQVRCISNFVEPRNRVNWQISLAIENLNRWLINFIENNYK